MNNITKLGDYTIEEAKAVFFDADALQQPPYTLYRLDGGDNRFYYTLDAKNRTSYFMSVTSFIAKTLATEKSFLIDWAVGLANEGRSYQYERNSKACYGTLMHIQAEKLLIEQEYDFDSVYDVVDAYTLEHGYRELMGAWCKRLQKDIASLFAFIQEHNVKPLAIEVMLADPNLRLAGAVDLLCEMDVFETVEVQDGVYKSGKRKGEPKYKKEKQARRVTAIVDFKSGENFYQEHEVQLGVYKMLVESNFGIKVDELFNWSPKKWRSEPTFNLECQTQKRSMLKIPHLLEIHKIDYPELQPRKPLFFTGKATINDNIKSFFERETLEDMLAKKGDEINSTNNSNGENNE